MYNVNCSNNDLAVMQAAELAGPLPSVLNAPFNHYALGMSRTSRVPSLGNEMYRKERLREE